MAIQRPDIYEHTNSTLAVVDSNFTRGGLKQLADFSIVTLATLKVDQLKEGNLLYITAGVNQGKLYKLIDISDHTQTSNWEVLGEVSSATVLAALVGQAIDATSITVDNVITTDVQAETSAGGVLKSSGGNACISFGAGGSANSTLGANLSGASTYKIVNIIDPTSPQDVSTKAYTDDGDNKISQTFTNIADTNFTIDFNNENFTINRHITSITADRTCTVSNAVSGSQFVIDVSIASGQVNHELIFSGPSSPTIIPDYINGTSNGVIFPGNASAATEYTVIGWYNGTQWRINVIDWN